MDILAELESMANIAANQVEDQDPDEDEIARWQELFGYTYNEAKGLIKGQRDDFSRRAVSDEHWQLVRADKEVESFSREAYEHSITSGAASCTSLRGQKHLLASPPVAQSSSSYLVRLEGKLNTAAIIQEIIGSPTALKTLEGISEDRDASFCQLDGSAKYSLEQWLLEKNILSRPTFIRLAKASKNLSPDSIYPTLGKDATLPQYRLHRFLDSASVTRDGTSQSINQAPLPLQKEYPVWYFFYGTLSDPDVLSQILSLSEGDRPPILIPASITGAKMISWGGKYKAVVDGPSTCIISGSAFKVVSEEQEDALLLYETDAYEVVRCTIQFSDKEVRGLTFRFLLQ